MDLEVLFSGLSDDALVGVNLNPDFEGAGEDPVELVWASNRKDSGFSHSMATQKSNFLPALTWFMSTSRCNARHPHDFLRVWKFF